MDLSATAAALAVRMKPAVQLSQNLPASYNSLPTELKLKIWEQVHHDGPGRIIPLQFSPGKSRHNAKDNTGSLLARINKYFQPRFLAPASPEKWRMFGSGHRFTSSVTSHPHLHFVDKISREVASKTSERLFSRKSMHGYILTDLSKDILLLSPQPTESSIAPAVNTFLAVLSSDQKSRLRYAAVECVSLPVPDKIRGEQPLGIKDHQLPLFEPNIVRYLFTQLEDSLELVALVGGYEKEGNVLGKGRKNSTLHLLDITRDFALDPNNRLSISDTQASHDMFFHCTLWNICYVRKRDGEQDSVGHEDLVELHIQVYCRGTLRSRLWGKRHEVRAKVLVEQIAKHYADVANDRTAFV